MKIYILKLIYTRVLVKSAIRRRWDAGEADPLKFNEAAGFVAVGMPAKPASQRYFWAMYFRKFLARMVIRTVPAIRTTDRALITGDTPNRIMEYT